VNKIEYGTEFLDQLKDSVHDLYDENKELKKEIERLNNRISKAIEYIEYVIFLNGHNAFKDRILEILKGEDNEL